MSKKKAGSIKPVFFAVLVLVGIAVACFWYFPGRSDNKLVEAKSMPVYYEMDSLLVNVSKTGNSNRYFKVKPVLILRHKSALNEIELYSPVIRSRLLALYSQESVDSLLADDGFDNLRKKSLAEMHSVLEGSGTIDPVADVLFNEYVIQ